MSTIIIDTCRDQKKGGLIELVDSMNLCYGFLETLRQLGEFRRYVYFIRFAFEIPAEGLVPMPVIIIRFRHPLKEICELKLDYLMIDRGANKSPTGEQIKKALIEQFKISERIREHVLKCLVDLERAQADFRLLDSTTRDL